ncbi:TPA: hypothetical protein EYP66_03260 [Candidatus Poribacteria bacterium]|nr:hypothetical protein [Candidatus Poribacteria bacterium]
MLRAVASDNENFCKQCQFVLVYIPKYRNGTLFRSIDELFEYENLHTNISKKELKDRIKKIGTLVAHRDIKDQYEASRAIIDAATKDATTMEKPAEIIRQVAEEIL